MQPSEIQCYESTLPVIGWGEVLGVKIWSLPEAEGQTARSQLEVSSWQY